MNKKIFLINCILFFLMCGLFSQTNLNEESIKNYRLALESFENKSIGHVGTSNGPIEIYLFEFEGKNFCFI